MATYTYEKEPILISADNHPANIVAFQARDIKEACIKADEALNQDGIQGAVWQKTPDQIEDIRKLGRSYNHLQTRPANKTHWLTGIIFGLLNKHYGAFLYRKFDNGDGVQFKLSRDFMAPHKNFETSIAREILDLSQMFTSLTVDRRIAPTPNTYVDAHYDGEKDPYFKNNNALLFNGHDVRILAPRKKSGTYIFDTDGKKWPYMCPQRDDGRSTNPEPISKLQPWEIQPGQYLFMHGLDRLGKAILHDTPIYEATKSNPRVLDVFDCRQPRTPRKQQQKTLHSAL